MPYRVVINCGCGNPHCSPLIYHTYSISDAQAIKHASLTLDNTLTINIIQC